MSNGVTRRATVIDGGTIESARMCEADGQKWRCGQQAALTLVDLIGTANVTCAGRGTDRHGRVLAVCYLDGLDFNAWLVARMSDRGRPPLP